MKPSFPQHLQALRSSKTCLHCSHRVRARPKHSSTVQHAHDEAFVHSRRSLLSTAVLLEAAQLLYPLAAFSTRLRSITWSEPCLLTVVNSTPLTVKAYWLNYDGDAELCTIIDPGSSWAVDTYASHPWRFVDADTGEVLQEFVASSSQPQLVRLDFTPPALPSPRSPTTAADYPGPKPAKLEAGGGEEGIQVVRATGSVGDEQAGEGTLEEVFEGWDGIGGNEGDYSPAMVAGIAVKAAGGLLRLLVSGFPAPLDLYSTKDDATSVLMAYTAETRRPLTTLTWTNTIKATGADVERVLITRVVSDTFYCRIVLTLPGGEMRSIDSRPSDGLALALQSDKPIYVANSIGRLQLDLLSARSPSPASNHQESFLPHSLPAPGTPNAAGPPPRPAGPKEAFPWTRAAVLDA